MSAGGPKTRFRTVDVKNVDVARIAELKRIVRGRLLMISVAATPSSADIRMAAEPPYSSIVRKTNVSATVMRPLTRGIGMAMSALAITISWAKWHSILWAMIHGVCSWFYVLYYAVTR